MSEILNVQADYEEEEKELVEKEGENVRHKKRRRGKKRRYRSRDSTQEDFEERDSEEPKIVDASTNDSKVPNNTISKKQPKQIIIRPVNVPKAPENSTQFIIDDHDECILYMNFESPNPCETPLSQSRTKDYAEDAAFQDIDYKYESMQDLDNSAYYLQDFEDSYFNMRYEELQRQSRTDLISTIESFEVRLMELENKLYEKDPGSALEQLQQKLLHLQEENALLCETNARLLHSVENISYEQASEERAHEPSALSQNCEHDTDEQSYDESDSSQQSQDECDNSENDEANVQDESFLPELNDQLHISYDNMSSDCEAKSGEDDQASDNREHLHNGNSRSASESSPSYMHSSTGNSQDAAYFQASDDIPSHTPDEEMEHVSDSHEHLIDTFQSSESVGDISVHPHNSLEHFRVFSGSNVDQSESSQDGPIYSEIVQTGHEGISEELRNISENSLNDCNGESDSSRTLIMRDVEEDFANTVD